MEIKAYWTEQSNMPEEFLFEAKFNAREKEMAIKVIENIFFIQNPLGDPREAEEE